MKRTKLVFICGVGLFLILTCSCAKQVINSGYSSKVPVMGNQSLVLSETEIQTLQSQALIGSSEAAWRLFGFYEYVRMDFAESLYWVRVAVENGDSSGEYTLGYILMRDDSDPRNRLRARFWLERAAQKGDKEAEELLKELPE